MKKILKKGLVFVLIVIMAFSATACKSKTDKNKQSGAKSGAEIIRLQAKKNNTEKDGENKQDSASIKTQSEVSGTDTDKIKTEE